jgi:mannose-6-phosphate isomerase-like protein (cupin superfamily)
MTIQNFSAQAPFITKDGSTIRSILDRTNAPVQNQSLAEARVPAGGRTERHYHKVAEELYFILEGAGEMELDGERRMVAPGRCDPHPSGRVAHDHGYRAVTLSLLLRAALCDEDTYLK